jgi:hypothetical protein
MDLLPFVQMLSKFNLARTSKYSQVFEAIESARRSPPRLNPAANKLVVLEGPGALLQRESRNSRRGEYVWRTYYVSRRRGVTGIGVESSFGRDVGSGPWSH